MAWTVVIRPSTMPNLSLITCKISHRKSKAMNNKQVAIKLRSKYNGYRSNLSQRSKTVGSAASIGNNVDIGLVFLLIDTHNKHGSIFAGGRDDYLLCTTLLNKKSQISPHRPLKWTKQSSQRSYKSNQYRKRVGCGGKNWIWNEVLIQRHQTHLFLKMFLTIRAFVNHQL